MKKMSTGSIATLLNRLEPSKKAGLVLIGPPCSGKSTFIRQLTASVPGIFIASTDDLIEREAKALGKTYSDIFRHVNFGELKREMMAGVQQAKAAHQHVTFDQTNMSRKSRVEKVQALAGMYLIAVSFSFEPQELARRNAQRALATGKQIPEHVMASMISSYQAPSKDEGFNELIELA
jgi:predicted kinase